MSPLPGFLLLIFFLSMGPLAHAAGDRTQTGHALAEVATAYENHRRAHGGKVLEMEGWADFDRLWAPGKQPGVFESVRLRERYEIVDWPSPFERGDRVVMVGRSPFREQRLEQGLFFGDRTTLGEKGRWLMVRSVKHGGLAPEWISEMAFKRWIKREDLLPPEPDPAGMYPHEVRYWAGISLGAVVLAGGGVLVVIVGRKLFIKRRDMSPAPAGGGPAVSGAVNLSD